jgi:2-keto-4-pentenoate hydratase/2-oxohepta-3-ene-1,7-dioic acid hydratase in catechol pathway
MDSFAPIGPAVVTKEDILDPHNLNLSCMVNGEVKQVDKVMDFFLE